MERWCGTDKSCPSVPRSKGCITCVSKRVRCDGRRPSCRNCEQRKQICRGYRRGSITFLNEGWKAPGIASCNDGSKERKCTRLAKETPRHHPTRMFLPNKLATHVCFFLSEFDADFDMDHDFFLRHLQSSCGLLITEGPWNQTGSAFSPVLPAVEALVESHFARIHGDVELAQQSMLTYGRALYCMSMELKRTRGVSARDMGDEQWKNMVFCCLVLALWELGMNPNSSNWQRHIYALANMMEARGPDHIQNIADFGVPSMSGLFIILDSLSNRKPAFLTSPQWRRPLRFQQCLDSSQASNFASFSIPMYGPQTCYEILIDELATIPALMSAHDELKREAALTDESSLHQKNQQLHESITTILGRFKSIISSRQFQASEIPVALWKSDGLKEREMLTEDAGGSLFATILYFHSTEEYHLLNICWSAAIVLHLLLYSLDSPTKTGSDDVECHIAALLYCAQQILRSVDYGFLPLNMRQAPFFFALSLKMVDVALKRVSQRECRGLEERHGSQLEWCRRMKDVAERCLKLGSSRKIAIKVDL